MKTFLVTSRERKGPFCAVVLTKNVSSGDKLADKHNQPPVYLQGNRERAEVWRRQHAGD